ncbi:MAG: peptidoglycan-binding protein, partial [Acidimicrobiia bacterium]
MSTTIDESPPVRATPRSSDSGNGDPAPPEPVGRRRRWLVGGAVLMLAAAGGLWLVLAGNGGNGTADAAASLDYADVVRTDLVDAESFDGTLGTIDGDPIKSSRSGVVSFAAEPGATVAEGDTLFAIDGIPVALAYGDTPMFRTLAPTVDSQVVTGRSNGTVTSVAAAGTTLEQGDVLYTVDGEPVVLLYGDIPAYRALRDGRDDLEGDDVLQLEEALDALGYNTSGSLSIDGVFTSYTADLVEDWQADIGAVADGSVDLGEVVFLPGPVTVLQVAAGAGDSIGDGREILTVTSGETTSGPDVAQLEAALAAFGYDAGGSLTVDGVFDAATTAAVLAWQEAIGADTDGVVELGDIVFLSGPVRINEQLAPPGTSINAGAEVLEASSSDKVVSVSLPAADQKIASAGDAVTVELPDGTEVPATIASVANVATDSSGGAPVFEMIVTLDDPN